MMEIAVVQTNPMFGAIDDNIERALQLMDTKPADLYVLPELFASGYNFLTREEVEDVSEEPAGRTCRSMHRFAREKSCYVVYGFAERSEEIYNSAALVGPAGLIGIYRKVHLFNREKKFFVPGDLGFPVFDLPIGRIGIMICFDWIFPESARTLALKGAQCIVHPSNLVLPHCPDAMVTRCLENRVFAATANRIGEETRGEFRMRFIGRSEIVAPDGEILSRMGTEQGIASVTIDIGAADRKQINEYNDLLSDRNPGQYR